MNSLTDLDKVRLLMLFPPQLRTAVELPQTRQNQTDKNNGSTCDTSWYQFVIGAHAVDRLRPMQCTRGSGIRHSGCEFHALSFVINIKLRWEFMNIKDRAKLFGVPGPNQDHRVRFSNVQFFPLWNTRAVN